MDGLNTVLEYLTSVPAWYLATSVGGQPHVRPFSFAQIQDGKLWFVMSPMIPSTVSRNLAGCAVSRKIPVSQGNNPSDKAR